MSEGRNRVLLLATGTLVAALVCELGIRGYDLARGRTCNARASWYWLYEQDPYLGWRGRPNAHAITGLDDFRHNGDGFRDDRDAAALASAASGRRLVICVGESSTYGVSAGSNDRAYPAMLERELRSLSGSDSWLVYNAGMPGYTSHEVMELINLRLLKLGPEIIVDMNLANDHDFMARYLDQATDYDQLPIRMAQNSKTTARELLMRSSLFAFIASRLRVTSGDDFGSHYVDTPHELPTARGLKLYLDNLAMTALVTKRSGVQLMLVDQPIDYTDLSGAEIKGIETMRRALLDFTGKESIPLLRAHSVLDWSG